MRPLIVSYALCAVMTAAPVLAQKQNTFCCGKGGASMGDYVLTALAGFKLEFHGWIGGDAPGYNEYFAQDGTWIAEIPGRVTFYHNGRWSVAHDRVCVYRKRFVRSCRKVIVKNENEVVLENVFSNSHKSFDLTKSKFE